MYIRQKQLEKIRPGHSLHGIDHAVPVIEVSHHADPAGIGSPHGEAGAFHSGYSVGVTYEILYSDVPDGVAINEAVEITKKYSVQEEASYVNGVLGTIARSKNA